MSVPIRSLEITIGRHLVQVSTNIHTGRYFSKHIKTRGPTQKKKVELIYGWHSGGQEEKGPPEKKLAG